MGKSVLYIGGCSGSATPELPRHEFGNHTTALGIVCGNLGIFIDNGSAAVKVASYLLENGISQAYGLQTHFHNDHRLGIHSNKLLFMGHLMQEIHAPILEKGSFKEIFERDFDKATWPIAPKDVCKKDINIVEFIPGESLTTPFRVKTLLQHHPGGSAAYRVSTDTGDIVISTDSEPTGQHLEELAHFISGASILYIDVMYRNAEYQGKVGICGGGAVSRVKWGHATPEMLYDVLAACKEPPKKIIIGHHDPARTAGDLFVFEKEAQTLLASFPSSIRFAREGEEIEV